MVVPLVAYGLAIGGSVVLGYGMDKLFGDGHYTGREFAIDVAMGASGMGAIKAVKHGAQGVRYYRHARKASKADDLVRMRDAASMGTQHGALAAGHAHVVRQAAKYDSHVRASNVSDGIVVEAIDDSIVVLPQSLTTVVSSPQSTAVVFPSRKRCEHMFKGQRCRRLAGHSGRHRYG